MSQEELGATVFSSSNHISYMETGVRAPSLELLVSIANAAGRMLLGLAVPGVPSL